MNKGFSDPFILSFSAGHCLLWGRCPKMLSATANFYMLLGESHVTSALSLNEISESMRVQRLSLHDGVFFASAEKKRRKYLIRNKQYKTLSTLDFVRIHYI